MNFVSAYEVASKSRKHGGYGGGRKMSDSVVFAIDRQWSKNKWRYSVRIGISPDVYGQARFLDGDKMDVLFDKESRMAKIVRVNEGGWMATPTGKEKSARRVLKFAWFEGMPSIAKTGGCEVVSVGTNSITVKLPEGVTFDKNAREESAKATATPFKIAR